MLGERKREKEKEGKKEGRRKEGGRKEEREGGRQNDDIHSLVLCNIILMLQLLLA